MKQFKNNELIGITGTIGAGKSYLANSFSVIYTQYEDRINVIEIDDIRRNLLWSSTDPLALDFRETLIKSFRISEYDNELFFNRNLFTDYIFSHTDTLQKFNELCKPFFIEEVKNFKKEDKVNLLVWVNLIEDNYLPILDFLIFVDVTEKVWLQRNINDLESLQKRIKFQTNYNEKIKLLESINLPYEVFYNE